MRGHIASALNLCLMDKVLEDLDRPCRSFGILALLAFENGHAAVDEALQHCEAR
jgi:hypothetical protein